VSYVGAPFTQDLFVSYSHGSDAAGNAFLAAWSLAFAKALETELRYDERLRDQLRLFIDLDHRPERGVDPLLPLTEQLRDQIGGSALLVVLMSGDYLRSSWCKQERDWWQQRQAELGLAHDGRIAVVRAAPCDGWPDLFKDSAGQPLVGFTFFAAVEGVIRPLGWTDPAGAFGTEFKRAILGLVGRLGVALDKTKATLDERRRTQSDVAKLAQQGGQAIYLHGRSEYTPLWQSTAMALNEEGFAVLPGEPERIDADPKTQQKARAQRVELMSECDALLLLGTGDGHALDADLVTIGKHDRQSARARSNRLLPCGVLNTAGDAVVTDVRKRTARNLQADWLEATQKTWTTDVARWLQGKSAQAQGV
jgi:hypothetical protein